MPTYAKGYKQAVLKTDEPKGLWVRILPLAFENYTDHNFQCEQIVKNQRSDKPCVVQRSVLFHVHKPV